MENTELIKTVFFLVQEKSENLLLHMRNILHVYLENLKVKIRLQIRNWCCNLYTTFFTN